MLVNRWDKKATGLSTGLKSLKTLVENLIVARNGDIGFMQVDKLLDMARTTTGTGRPR